MGNREKKVMEEFVGDMYGDDESNHPHKNRRKTTWVERATGFGALVAIAATIVTSAAYVLDALPFAKAADMKNISERVGVVEKAINAINIGQKETQELQLIDRIQSLDDRLAKLQQGSDDYQYFRQQRNESQQRLDTIRSELATARASLSGTTR